MLRLTAKATQFGRRTFTSWLIESAGTVPIKRRKDYVDGSADNSDVMEKLMQVGISPSFSLVLLRSQPLSMGKDTGARGRRLRVPGRDQPLSPHHCTS